MRARAKWNQPISVKTLFLRCSPHMSQQGRSNGWAHFTAGAISGTINCVTLQPLDLVKTRLQQHPDHGTMRSTFRAIFRSDGITGLWRGTVPTILRNTPGSAMYFTTLHALRSVLSRVERRVSGESRVYHFANAASGGAARLTVGWALMPLTVLKVRFESDLYRYRSIREAMRGIIQTEGIRGLFAGYGSTAMRDAPFAGLYVLFYEHLRSIATAGSPSIPRIAHFVDENNVAAWMVNSSAAAVAGFAATLITHPFDVLRVRIQLDPKQYRNIWHATQLLRRREGLRGYFAGLVPRLARKTVSTALTWTIYEEVVSLMHRQ